MLFIRNQEKISCCCIIVDETWILLNIPLISQQSKLWFSPCKSTLKKSNLGLSIKNSMVTVFWDALGIIHIDYLQKGETVNDENCANMFDRLNADWKKEQSHLVKKKVLCQQDNAGVLRVMNHPPYSQNSAPSDQFLFPKLIIVPTNASFEDLDTIWAAVKKWRTLDEEYWAQSRLHWKMKRSLSNSIFLSKSYWLVDPPSYCPSWLLIICFF